MRRAAIPTISRLSRVLAIRPRGACVPWNLSLLRHTREFILATPTLVVLEGDQTGQELLLEALRVLDPSVIGLSSSQFERYDLSLANRRATTNAVVFDAADAMKRHRLGLKAATITPEGRDDVGSPNRILREAIGGKRDRPHRPQTAARAPGRRHPRADLRRAHGRRRRVRRQGVARGRRASTRSRCRTETISRARLPLRRRSTRS